MTIKAVQKPEIVVNPSVVLIVERVDGDIVEGVVILPSSDRVYVWDLIHPLRVTWGASGEVGR